MIKDSKRRKSNDISKGMSMIRVDSNMKDRGDTWIRRIRPLIPLRHPHQYILERFWFVISSPVGNVIGDLITLPYEENYITKVVGS